MWVVNGAQRLKPRDTTTHTREAIKATAERAGHTRHVSVEAGASDLYGYIKPNADLDGTFTLIDDEDATVFNVNVNGWICQNIEDLDD